MNFDGKRRAIADRARRGKKVDRSAFLYLEPEDGDPDFAQCGDCALYLAGECAIMGIAVEKGWSCGFFIPDEPGRIAKTARANVTPEEAGLYKGRVRCENCRYGGATCALYDKLNAELPGDFALDAKISPKGCCNAFTP